MLVGYCRTSTPDQVAGLEDQLAELKRAGVERCYSEHVSALAEERPQLMACLKWLREGDTLVVTKPDRLERSVVGLLRLDEDLRGRGVGLKVLSLNLDTASATGRLTLSVLGAVAAWEREMMLERQRAGIVRAKALGKFKGRPATVERMASDIVSMRAAGMTPAAIASALKCHRSSVYRVLKGAQTVSKEAAE